MTKIEKMWAISGCYGLYIGTWLTRRDAIRSHSVSKKLGFDRDWNAKDVRNAWKECQQNGDKAVKVEIKYEN